MNCIALFLVSLFILAGQTLNADLSFLPKTSEEVTAYLEQSETEVLKTIDQLTGIRVEEKTFDNTFHTWNRLSNQLLADFGLLSFLSYAPFPSQQRASAAIEELKGFLFKEIQLNTDLQETFLSCIEKEISQRKLNPYEQYVFYSVLEEMEEDESIEKLKESTALADRKPFLYLKGVAEEKRNSEQPLSVLSINTCFSPGALPQIHGGVTSWQERLNRFAEKILEVNADIVCLQEVHAEEASSALFKGLREVYSHFYTAIGPRPLGTSLSALGLPSGLFVASKYLLKNPTFTLFAAKRLPMNWGVFDFVVNSDEGSLAHVYTTHFHSLNHETFPEIRAAQLSEIVDKMQRDLSASPEIPFYLCGDLNIPLGAKEPGELLIQTHFHDDFNKEGLAISDTHRTFTDYFTNYLFSPTKNPEEIDPDFQILDYALLLKSSSTQENESIKTSLIPMNHLDHPETALTDHHGLLTTLLTVK